MLRAHRPAPRPRQEAANPAENPRTHRFTLSSYARPGPRQAGRRPRHLRSCAPGPPGARRPGRSPRGRRGGGAGGGVARGRRSGRTRRRRRSGRGRGARPAGGQLPGPSRAVDRRQPVRRAPVRPEGGITTTGASSNGQHDVGQTQRSEDHESFEGRARRSARNPGCEGRRCRGRRRSSPAATSGVGAASPHSARTTGSCCPHSHSGSGSGRRQRRVGSTGPVRVGQHQRHRRSLLRLLAVQRRDVAQHGRGRPPERPQPRAAAVCRQAPSGPQRLGPVAALLPQAGPAVVLGATRR